MRCVLQRVSRTSVVVESKILGTIGVGILALVGFEESDTEDDIDWMVNKISNLRIFNDPEGVMNLSIIDTKGEFLVVSQFTLYAKTKKGNRPSYIRSAHPDVAIPLYKSFVKKLREYSQLAVQEGVFGAKMDVNLVNDGPVTIFIDTKNKE
jgi:D-aminoacyl-tRNA deacylase